MHIQQERSVSLLSVYITYMLVCKRIIDGHPFILQDKGWPIFLDYIQSFSGEWSEPSAGLGDGMWRPCASRPWSTVGRVDKLQRNTRH